MVEKSISLKAYNTFSINVLAQYFTSFDSLGTLIEILSDNKYSLNEKLILGGGSNILFTKNFDGLVLKNEIKGIEIVKEDAEYVYVKAAAGENWHQLVLYCIDKNLAGLENLSLIPGCVGASPMQNIGAYGVEIKDAFLELEAFHLKEKNIVTFNATDCQFGYRESIFKNRFKGQFIILNVTFRLCKNPNFDTSYGAINQELEQMGIQELSIQAISQAVINIRSSKLPDPKQIGNAGSFFKNPTISAAKYQALKDKYPEMVGYPIHYSLSKATNSLSVTSLKEPDACKVETFKLAAGWLIEKCGWKGFRDGDAGVHNKQALVLVNYGQASGNKVYTLSQKIILSVQEKFNIILEREVNIF